MHESLEPRMLLASHVTAAVVGGDLLVQGDRFANAIVIEYAQSPGSYRITGAGTTVNDGQTELLVSGVTGDIRVLLGRGKNSAVFRGQLPHNLLISGSAPGGIRVEQAAIEGSLTLVGSGQSDAVNVQDTEVRGRTILRTGSGADTIAVDAGVFHGGFALTSGDGRDTISIDDSTFHSAHSIRTGPGRDRSTIGLHYDFRDGAQGWEAGFADCFPWQPPFLARASGIRPLPAELGVGTGFLLSGGNTTDDLLMYLTRSVGAAKGLQPNRFYQLRYTIQFGSNAPTGAIGAGGPPGEAVFLKAGGTTAKPVPREVPGMILLDVGDGPQRNGGTAMSVVGNIANGNTDVPSPYVSLTREHTHTRLVKADAEGQLYLLTGTDSGFEGDTLVYFQRIDVKLVAVE